MFNVTALHEALEQAGIPIHGVSANGEISFKDEATQQQRDDAAAIAAAHNPAVLAKEQEVEAARAAIVQGKKYLQRQILSATPDTPTQIVSTIKPVVDGNVYLTRMMSNQIAVMNGAFGWTLDLNPATAQNRQRYIVAVEMVIALLG